MLSDAMFLCYAVTGKDKLTELPYSMDAETDVVVELWKYDPAHYLEIVKSDTISGFHLSLWNCLKSSSYGLSTISSFI